MASAPVGVVLQHLRKLASAHTLAATPDHLLLERFVNGREEAAFEALVARHGPMVYHVCRRVLMIDHDAEDAFQATFLVLARQARSIRKRTSLASWLHGVAHHIAGKARISAQRRTARERQTTERPQASPLDDVTWRELRMMLDEELARLPEQYRGPLVLCYLEERTQDEAARQLGWSKNTFRRRLERGRELLRIRLARRGITLSAGLSATLLAGQATKSVAASLAAAAVKMAMTVAVGETAAVSANVAALAEGAVGSSIKLKLAAALVLMASIIAAGAAVGYQPGTETQAAANDDQPKAEGRKPTVDAQGDALPAGAIARLGTMRLRHGFALSHAILSPDGKLLASAGFGRGVCLWDAATGKELRVFLPTWRGVGRIDFSPDGKLLAGGDGPVYLWDVATGKELHRLKLEKERSDQVHVVFSPDGKLLAVADGKLVHLWDSATAREVRRLEGPDGWIGALAFAPDSKMLATTHQDMNLRLWDVAKGSELHRLLSPPPEFMTRYPSIAFSPDGKILASAAFGKMIQLLDPKTGKQVRSWECDSPGGVGMAFSPDGKVLVSGGGDGILRCWDPATGKELRQWQTRGPALRSVAFSKDGTRLVTTALWESCPRLWDVATGKELLKFAGHDATVEAITFTPDGKALLSGGRDRAVLRWDLAAGKETHRFAVPSAGFSQLAFAADAKRVVSFSWQDGAVCVLDLASGEQVRLLDKLGKQEGQFLPSSLALSRDGRLAAAVEDGKAVHVWDLPSGKQLRRIGGPAGRANSIAFSPDGKRLAAASGGPNSKVGIWEIERGFMVWTKSTGSVNGPLGVSFSPDGKRLITYGWDGQVRLWDIAATKEVRIFSEAIRGFPPSYYHAAFSPDGRFLAAAGGEEDKSVHVWEVNTGLEVRRFQGHLTAVSSVAFSPDGRSLASGGADSMIYLWDLTNRMKDGRMQPLDLTERDLDARWKNLASSDGPRTVQAVWDLATNPKPSVPFLQKKLRRPEPVEEKQLKKLIGDLDSDQFDVRSAAAKELERIGEQAEPALRKALAANPSPEAKLRIELLLEKLDPEKSPARLRELRAVQALEYAGTAEARRVLEELMKETGGSLLTREAKAALKRIK